MRRLLVIAMVIGTGAIGFAAASQAGMSIRPAPLTQSETVGSIRDDSFTGPECRVEKTLKYDFDGNPYIKKVRVCA